MDRLLSEDCPAKLYRRTDFNYTSNNSSDETILDDIRDYLKKNSGSKPIFISNDRIFRFRAKEELEIECQDYRDSKPFLSDTEIYTGVIQDGEEFVKNCFFWREGKLFSEKENKMIDYENEIWKVRPRTVYQNMLMELFLDEDIDVVTVQSAAGYGKTFLALAAALQLTFQKQREQQVVSDCGSTEDQPKKKRGRKKKPRDEDGNIIHFPKHKKIFVVRPTITIGEELGFLPGDLAEKIDPYFRPIKDLLIKLHELRPCNRLFVDGDPKKGFEQRSIEFLPINYLRGMNIENAYVVVDECLANDQKILMADGSKIQIDDLYQRNINGEELKVLSYNEEMQIVEEDSIVCIKQKKSNEKMYKITLDDGTILKLTENHRLYIEGMKIKRIKDLSVGEKLIIKND